ncbi:MAG: di-trans,poly-cis-decaprenylcistransferase [Rickettsiales bacterium]|nr:di-trans,poly-cis-decaprenylcistransferase [Rickettsiales bacterium]
MEESLSKFPQHVAIIMDGNRRWAGLQSKGDYFGHKAGLERVSDVIQNSLSLNIKYLTLYAFSSENWNRSESEVSNLKFLMNAFLDKHSNELIAKNVRLRVIGNYEDFGKNIAKKIEDVVAKSLANSGMHLTIALSYGSKNEILRAVNNICQDGLKNVDQKQFSSYLYTHDLPDPDLMIRTGGEYRLSNFLLWQMAYAELYFTDILWPDFDKNSLLKACEFFVSKNRRFGGD